MIEKYEKELLAHVVHLAEVFSLKQVHQVILMILMDLCIPTNYAGYEYLIHAIMIHLEAPELITSNGLYEAIAARIDRGVRKDPVETAIRSAIIRAWKIREDALWWRYFAPVMIWKQKALSNTEVITGIVRAVHLWKGCCEARERRLEIERRAQYEAQR